MFGTNLIYKSDMKIIRKLSRFFYPFFHVTSMLVGESCCVVLWQTEHRTCEYLVRFSVLFGTLPTCFVFLF